MARVADVPTTSQVRAITVTTRHPCCTEAVPVTVPSSHRADSNPMSGSAITDGRGDKTWMASRRAHARYAATGTTKYACANGSCDQACSRDAAVARWTTTATVTQRQRTTRAARHDTAEGAIRATSACAGFNRVGSFGMLMWQAAFGIPTRPRPPCRSG